MSEKEKVDKAIKLYNDGKYQEAIDAFSSVLEVCQDNAELYNNIALCYANLGEYEKAFWELQKVLELIMSTYQTDDYSQMIDDFLVGNYTKDRCQYALNVIFEIYTDVVKHPLKQYQLDNKTLTLKLA